MAAGDNTPGLTLSREDMKLLFVGERPSDRAVKIGATWESGKLAGKQLKDALEHSGVVYNDCTFLNLWQYESTIDEVIDFCAKQLGKIQTLLDEGYKVIALGRLVSSALTHADIDHVYLVHPAARGAIRKKENYQKLVKELLERINNDSV